MKDRYRYSETVRSISHQGMRQSRDVQIGHKKNPESNHYRGGYKSIQHFIKIQVSVVSLQLTYSCFFSFLNNVT